MLMKCEVEDFLKQAGVAEAVVEEAVKLTAPLRHKERVKQALSAAEKWALTEGPSAGMARWRSAADAKAICFLEAHGLHGGGLKNPGAGTTRHPAFRDCGSGRRNANDGPVWTAAIASAGDGCEWSANDNLELSVRVPPTAEQPAIITPVTLLLKEKEEQRVACRHAIQYAAEAHDVDVLVAAARLLSQQELAPSDESSSEAAAA
jgi:hypothetical protein